MKKMAFIVILFSLFLLPALRVEAKVIRKEGKTYIVDRTGDQWDITQAVSIGFRPSGFQFGIGKNAFNPLDDTHLSENRRGVPDHTRVIGVEDGESGKAYSVSRLSRHEVSNSTAEGKPVAVGY